MTPLGIVSCAGSILFALASLATADVLSVGPAGSGAQFSEIQAAVSAAEEDDVLLVQPGTYARIVVEKPLCILGVGPGVVIDAVADQSAVIVRGIGAGREFVLAGVRAETDGFFLRPRAVQLENSPGTLVLQDVTIAGERFEGMHIGLSSTNCARVFLLESQVLESGELEQQTGAVVVQSSELWLVGCEIRGADDPYFALSGAHGLQATDSTVHVWRSSLTGGGAEGKNGIGDGMGGAAVRATRSRIELFGGPLALLRGGNGEELIFGEGFGGPGVELLDHSSARIQQAIPITGGNDGSDLTQAPPVRADGTSAYTLDAALFPTLASSSPSVALGGSFALTLTGNPGARQRLFVALATGPTLTSPKIDGLGVLGTAQLVAEVVLPASGTLTRVFHVPSSSALLGATLFFQALERPAANPMLPQPISGSAVAFGNPVLVTLAR